MGGQGEGVANHLLRPRDAWLGGYRPWAWRRRRLEEFPQARKPCRRILG